MTIKEGKEHRRLGIKWLNKRASKKEILRCMELDRKAELEAAELREYERARKDGVR